MSTSVPTPEEFIASFPNATISKIDGQPDYESLNNIRRLLKSWRRNIRSSWTHRRQCNLHRNRTWNSIRHPVNPGTIPPIAATATQAQIAVAERNHKENLCLWREFQSLHTALKSQLTIAIPEIYLRAIRNRHVGFAQRSIQEIFTHLFTNYGNISPQDLVNNQWRVIQQHERRPNPPTDTQRHQTTTTSHTSPDGQFHSCRNCQQRHQAKQVPLHGHALSLGPRQGPTRPVQRILGQRQPQQSRLLYQASLSQPSSTDASPVPLL